MMHGVSHEEIEGRQVEQRSGPLMEYCIDARFLIQSQLCHRALGIP